MRCVKITRKKSFVGSLIPYSIFVGYRKAESDPRNPHDEWDFPDTIDARTANGQTVTIPVRDEKCCILAEVNTSTGAARSTVYTIDEGSTDVELELVTRYSWIHGSQYVLRPVEAAKK